MRKIFKAVSILVLTACLLQPLAAEEAAEVLFIHGAKIHTVTSGTIESGSILIRDGKIAEIGMDISRPEGAEVFDASGMVITPGLIDSHSHLGLGASGGTTEDNEGSNPSTPQMRIIDSIHPTGMAPHEYSFRDAVAEGVTTIIARPGSGNVIGGQSAALKLTGGTVDDMVIKFPADMKMAMGKKGYGAKGQLPVTRMGVAYVVRQAMVDAMDYKNSLENYEKKKESDPDAIPPKRDLKNEAMLMVLNREIPVHIHCSRIDDILTAVRLADEFDFYKLSLGHGNESWKIADVLAEKGITVVVGPGMVVYDENNNLVNLAKVLVDAGVEINIMTDADVTQQEFLRYQAATAVRYGLDPQDALKAITINPAKLIEAEDRIGSLEAGKDADLVIFDGDPFDIRTKVRRVFINGVSVFENEQ
ncbi:MAG: amidohydrolase [Acidobacteriota bacterium]